MPRAPVATRLPLAAGNELGLPDLRRSRGPAATPPSGPPWRASSATADDVGFDSIWVMDHFFQIRGVGPADDPMLEGWTTLGFMAAHTTRARLGLMVGGVHYRHARRSG